MYVKAAIKYFRKVKYEYYILQGQKYCCRQNPKKI